jgi:heat-inducible transcriptional repressor
VPTDKGYRLFVDRLSAIKPLSTAERRAIERFLDGAVDLHDVLGRTVRLLAQLTRQVAVVQYPALSRSAVRHLEIVQVADARLLLVLITDTGRVEQRVVECPSAVDAEDVAELRTLLNSAFVGRKLAEAGSAVPDLLESAPPHLRMLVGAVGATLVETLVEPGDDRLVIGGTANLARVAMDFPGSLRPLMEALEEQVVVLRLMSEVDPSHVLVRIGEENAHESLVGASVVTVGYGSGERSAGSASSGPPAWTIPETWPRSAPWPATSARSWPRAEAKTFRWQRTTTGSSASPRAPATPRSSGPTGGWRGTCTPTSTPTPAPRSASRRSPAPTRR